MVVNERLKEEIDRKKVLPDTQPGFRKGRETINNIYILQHIIEKELVKEKGKLFTFFVDLKAAFDKVDRKILWEAMKKLGISPKLIDRIKRIYEETKCKVKVGENKSEEFWTK